MSRTLSGAWRRREAGFTKGWDVLRMVKFLFPISICSYAGVKDESPPTQISKLMLSRLEGQGLVENTRVRSFLI
jgi:hypothetical protein